MLAEIRTGIQQSQDGAVNPARAGRFNELIGGEAVGKYYEIARQGRIFCASMQAGASLGTALTATAVTFTLYNPSASGVNLSLLQCGVCLSTEVVNAETGILVYAANVDPSAAIPSATTPLTVRPALLGASANSAGRAFSAATLPATPVVVRVFPLAHNQVATTATSLSGLAAVDYVDGALALAPNTAVTIQQIKTTADSGIVSMVWAEIPV
jgi:hypothetical protein